MGHNKLDYQKIKQTAQPAANQQPKKTLKEKVFSFTRVKWKKLWAEGYLFLAIPVLATHWAIHHFFPDFWDLWWKEDGFILWQILLLGGIFLTTRRVKFSKLAGCSLALLGLFNLIFSGVNAGKDVSLLSKDIPADIPGFKVEKGNDPVNEMREFFGKELSPTEVNGLIEVAWWESRFRQFGDDGKPLIHRNSDGSTDIGRFQINSVHWPKAKELNFDLRGVKDNMAMAAHLYKKQGFRPWRQTIRKHQSRVRLVADAKPPLESSGIHEVVAPVEKPSEPIWIGGRHTIWAPTGDILVFKNDEDKPRLDGPGKICKLGDGTFKLRFQSAGTEPVKVAVSID